MTSYVKMIDIWLLSNLIIPFVEVLLQTYIEHIRGQMEDKKEMNHHGKTIVVQNGDNSPRKPSTISLSMPRPTKTPVVPLNIE